MNDDTFSEMNDSVTDAIAAWMTEHRQFDHERVS